MFDGSEGPHCTHKIHTCPASQHISPPLSRGRAWDGGTEGQGGGEGMMSAGSDDVDNERRDG